MTVNLSPDQNRSDYPIILIIADQITMRALRATDRSLESDSVYLMILIAYISNILFNPDSFFTPHLRPARVMLAAH